VLVVERRRAPLLAVEANEPFAEFVRALFTGRLTRELDARQWAALYATYAGGERF
jgi:hypothetical protein